MASVEAVVAEPVVAGAALVLTGLGAGVVGADGFADVSEFGFPVLLFGGLESALDGAACAG